MKGLAILAVEKDQAMAEFEGPDNYVIHCFVEACRKVGARWGTLLCSLTGQVIDTYECKLVNPIVYDLPKPTAKLSWWQAKLCKLKSSLLART